MQEIAGPVQDNHARGGRSARNAAIATFGNAIEWSDFTIFGFLTIPISRVFFPAVDPLIGLLAAFTTFGVGFLARPIGAAIFGRLGDSRGRRVVMIISISLMAAGSFLIGCAPTYARAGLAGPAVLVFGRLLQGLSAGAEFGTAVVYLIEWAPPDRRGFYGSLHQLGAAFGLVFGASLMALLNTMLTPAAILAGGWRFPFIVGGVLAVVALRLRLTLAETPEFEALLDRRGESIAPATPARSTLGPVLQNIGLTALWSVGVFASVIYMPTFAVQFGNVTPARALWATVIGGLVMLPIVPLTGIAADRWGVKPVLAVGVLGYLFWSLPGYLLIVSGAGYPIVVLIVVSFAVLAGIVSGVGPLSIGQLFETERRSTWTSISSALAITLFGGFAPLISTLLIRALAWPAAPALYLIVVAAVTGITTLSLRSRSALRCAIPPAVAIIPSAATT